MASSSHHAKPSPSSVATATLGIPELVSESSQSISALLDLDLSEESPPPPSSSSPSVIAPVLPPPTLDLANPSIILLDPWLLRFSAA
jgi:hypothetical protein